MPRDTPIKYCKAASDIAEDVRDVLEINVIECEDNNIAATSL